MFDLSSYCHLPLLYATLSSGTFVGRFRQVIKSLNKDLAKLESMQRKSMKALLFLSHLRFVFHLIMSG